MSAPEKDQAFEQFLQQAMTRRDGPDTRRREPKNPRRVDAMKASWARRRAGEIK